MTRITDIVDNRAAEGFVAEHGLSLLIEHGDERILFDTGAGTALQPNAAKLGIDLDDVTRIVLSHSHNDHTGGLGGLVPKCPIHVGAGFDVPCFSKHADGSVRSLAVSPDAKAVLAAADVRVGRQFDEIAKGIYLSGRIERTSGEDNGKSFYCDESCTERNYVLEEQALLTEDGVLVTGCCHAGIMNTVQAFRRAVPHIAIRTIVGGLHLCHATDEEIAQTGDFLKRLNLGRLILLHCTGEAAGAKLKEMLSCPVVWGAAITSAWTNPNSNPEGCCNALGLYKFLRCQKIPFMGNELTGRNLTSWRMGSFAIILRLPTLVNILTKML